MPREPAMSNTAAKVMALPNSGFPAHGTRARSHAPSSASPLHASAIASRALGTLSRMLGVCSSPSRSDTMKVSSQVANWP